jgi:hypothetical protein
MAVDVLRGGKYVEVVAPLLVLLVVRDGVWEVDCAGIPLDGWTAQRITDNYIDEDRPRFIQHISHVVLSSYRWVGPHGGCGVDCAAECCEDVHHIVMPLLDGELGLGAA